MGGCIVKSDTRVHTDDIFYLQLSLGEGEPPLEVAAMVCSASTRGIAFKFLRAAQENSRISTRLTPMPPPEQASEPVFCPQHYQHKKNRRTRLAKRVKGRGDQS